MNTSPGRIFPWNFRFTAAIASGTDPRWSGSVSPWAIRRPSASQRAQDMSIEFLRLFE